MKAPTTPSVVDGGAAYECNGQPVSADAFYAIACNPRRNVAVEACAGAGKTWMLVSRIVRALLEGVDPLTGKLGVQPHEILAITFTNRAAAEMRGRLQEWLAQFAKASPEALAQELATRGIQTPGRGTGDELKIHAGLIRSLCDLYQSTLDCERQVQIRTFHSWFAALLRTAPLAVLQQLELPFGYELLEDDSAPKALVLRHFYARLASDSSLRADFSGLVFEHGRHQAEKALQTALDKRVEFVLADAQGVVDTSVVHFSHQFPEFASCAEPEDYLLDNANNLQLLYAAAKALGSANAPTFAAAGVELEASLAVRNLPRAFNALLTLAGTPRKFDEKIVGIATVREAQALVLRTVEVINQHTAWQHQMRMGRLTRMLIAEYAALKRERGWVDMNDVERAARFMLGDAVLSGWVQQRLDTQVKHLLIDEFQDTNPLQWQALLSWLGSYAGSGGGSAPSVFLVGDPKQSIYRFRRAEPQVFRAAQAFVREGLQGDLLSCDHTRRNAHEVINTVNTVMLAAQETGEFEGFRTHTTSATTTGWVSRLPVIPRDAADTGGPDRPQGQWRDSLTEPQVLPEETLRTLEARQAARWIAGHVASGMKPQDIMALSRKRASLAPLQDELRKLQIAAQIGENTELADCCEVQDIVALLDVLVSPQHDLSLARVLKSPLFALGDEVLVQLALQQRQEGGTWFDLLQKKESPNDDLKTMAASLARWKAWVDQLPPHDALQAIFDDGDVLARFATQAPAVQRGAVLSNLHTLLNASLQLGDGRFVTPYGFVRALKAGGVKAPAAVVETAVRLLTIHGAKGLEADVVLLLDTDTKERNPDTMGVLVDWPGEHAAPVKFVFLASESNPPACAAQTLEREVAQRQREEINTLYVAMTRARTGLALSSIEPAQPNESSWWARLSEVAGASVNSLEYVDLPGDAGLIARETHFLLPELPLLTASAKVLDPSTSTAAVDHAGDKVDSASARVGKAMHRLLEWCDVSDRSAAVVAREFDLSASQSLDAQSMAQRILRGEGAWAWDEKLIAWQGDEVALMYQGTLVRIDRLVQLKGSEEWWVLDYKSSAAPQDDPELVAQLVRYRDAVQAIHPGAVVKAAFLSGQGLVIAI
jgi:ATP-dependent helicase/nuclease subunit A